MPIRPGPFDIQKTRLVLDPEGCATARPVTPTFFQDLAEFGSFAGHLLISQGEFDAPWETWEIHPHGDEFVYLLSGDTDFLLKGPDGERSVRLHQAGTYVVVPRGNWHTARPRRPTSLLFVTPGEATENREKPE